MESRFPAMFFTGHPRRTVLIATLMALAIGFFPTPFWDEDEPRFAAIARAMVETGDWIVPRYNGELAVDKPVLMHWCMAVGFLAFGFNEFAARLPSALAAVATALAILRAGSRWFDVTTGMVAALASTGCLLVAIEAHAATPDAILTALTTWAAVLALEPFLPDRRRDAQATRGTRPLSPRRTALIGSLLGLAVICKGPIGFVGPLAVILPAVWLIMMAHRWEAAPGGHSRVSWLVGAGLETTRETLKRCRIGLLTLITLAVAAPWYLAVWVRTDGEWIEGFFFIHNVGRFVAPMERHAGGFLFHPLTMLVGFYPWSCFLPLTLVLVGWRITRQLRVGGPIDPALTTLLVWLAAWVGGFSLAATKLPNYVLPAYPGAALLVAAVLVDAARRPVWPHAGWLATGLGFVAFGGLATSVTILVATHFGLTAAEPAMAVGIVPILGALACLWIARRDHGMAVAALTVTSLLYTALAVGPAAAWIGRANALPSLIERAQRQNGHGTLFATYTQSTPNVVYYAGGSVAEFHEGEEAAVIRFLESSPGAVVLVQEDRLPALTDRLPAGVGVLDRARPLFKEQDVVVIGRSTTGERTAHTGVFQR